MPSSPGYKRNYVQERLAEDPKRRKDRAARNKARAIMEKKGLVHKGDGKDVGHVKAISRGGKTTPGNLMVQSAAANRSFARKSSGAMASETSAKERKRKSKG
jgi:hypothetical protein